ncbi:MAG: glycosyltransferase family A protein [Alteraurantiacibacter sp.]
MRVSVIIPAFNRADLIGATLDSLLAQTRPPAEIVLVDDGSTDGTPDVVSAYGSSVRLIRQENAGAAAARNHGFIASTGDAIHFMDSDDLSSPNSHAVQLAAIEAGADMAYGPWLKTRFSGQVVAPEPVVIQQSPVPPGVGLDQRILGTTWVTVFQPCLLRRTLVEAAGPYRTDLKPSEDTEMLYRLLCRARHVVHTPQTIVLYRVHPENQVSEAQPVKRLIDWARLQQVLADHAARRTDLDPATLTDMHFARTQAALEVYPHDASLATALVPGISATAPLGHRIERLKRRIATRLRRVTTGARYGSAYAVGPLGRIQREQIELMGYTAGKIV